MAAAETVAANLTPMNPSQFSIRPAQAGDAERLIHIHFAAVHGIAEQFYPSAVLTAWSPTPSASRYEWMRMVIDSATNNVLVAEMEQIIGGFAIYVPSSGFIQALYVDPQFTGRGLGKALLVVIENQLAQAGVSAARLNASHNAAKFYRRAGFQVLAPTTQTLSDGTPLECVAMQKLLESG